MTFTVYDLSQACAYLPRLGLLDRFDRIIEIEDPLASRVSTFSILGGRGGRWTIVTGEFGIDTLQSPDDWSEAHASAVLDALQRLAATHADP